MMDNSRMIEVQRTLATAALIIASSDRLPNGTGTQIRLSNDGVVNVFDSGRVTVQGKCQNQVRRALGPLVAAPPLGERECLVCRSAAAPHIHHLDGNHDNDSPANLVDLCPVCHAQLNLPGGSRVVTVEQMLEVRGKIDAARKELGRGDAEAS